MRVDDEPVFVLRHTDNELLIVRIAAYTNPTIM